METWRKEGRRRLEKQAGWLGATEGDIKGERLAQRKVLRQLWKQDKQADSLEKRHTRGRQTAWRQTDSNSGRTSMMQADL